MYKFNISRNKTQIALQPLREKVDTEFENLHDTLSDCYYNYWKHGKSKPFASGKNIYDVQSTLEESKKLFDDLHGLIFNEYQVKLEEEYNLLPEEQKDEKIIKYFAKTIDEPKTKTEIAQEKIVESNQKGIIIERPQISVDAGDGRSRGTK